MPSEDDWWILINFLGNGTSDNINGKLREIGTEHWIAPNEGATNKSGFTGLPGGITIVFGGSYYEDLGFKGYWWSSSNR